MRATRPRAITAKKAAKKAVDYGGAGYGIATSGDDPTGAALAAGGLGIALADVTPVIGNLYSIGTGVYDLRKAYRDYKRCMAGSTSAFQ